MNINNTFRDKYNLYSYIQNICKLFKYFLKYHIYIYIYMKMNK